MILNDFVTVCMSGKYSVLSKLCDIFRLSKPYSRLTIKYAFVLKLHSKTPWRIPSAMRTPVACGTILQDLDGMGLLSHARPTVLYIVL